jgi:hypothetical protein
LKKRKHKKKKKQKANQHNPKKHKRKINGKNRETKGTTERQKAKKNEKKGTCPVHLHVFCVFFCFLPGTMHNKSKTKQIEKQTKMQMDK